ncbi:MAG: DUF4287 domain-containing protein [bacterium]|nr:DUF4287 domain-containing protein [bacterium]
MKNADDATATMIANLKEKTGKTLTQWFAVVKKSKLGKHGEIVKHLKGDHGMTHGYANLVAHQALGSAAATLKETTDLVATQYSGKKAGLRPIYDSLVKKIEKLGKDVELSPKKAYVSLRRSKQFGLVQPSTATRVDLGLNIKGKKPDGRLEASGSFNSMCTHRVRIESVKDIDKEVVGWLKEAYELA